MRKWIVLKIIVKITLRFTLKQLRHVSVQSHHHQGAHYSCLLKLQLLKWPIIIYRCVVMWLHILVGPCWCMYVYVPNSAMYAHQKGPTDMCSHITTHRCILIGNFNNFGGLEVSVLAFGTRVCGFEPGRSRRRFRAKKSSAHLPLEGK